MLRAAERLIMSLDTPERKLLRLKLEAG